MVHVWRQDAGSSCWTASPSVVQQAHEPARIGRQLHLCLLQARVCKLDSDAEPDLSSELRVAGLPTLLFFAEGREVHRLEGVPGNEDALAAIVREHLGVEV